MPSLETSGEGKEMVVTTPYDTRAVTEKCHISPFMGPGGSRVSPSSGCALTSLGQAGGWRPACAPLQPGGWRWHVVTTNALPMSD